MSGQDNNIGLLRYLLAVSIVIHHANALAGTDWLVPVDARVVVNTFFVLSGYLAWSSWQRHPQAVGFVWRRCARLLPAYWAVILAAAFGLASVSSLPFADYLTHPAWWRYVVYNLCMLNFAAPDLPGVFTGLPLTAVNGALWYVKVELILCTLPPLSACLSRWAATRFSKNGCTYRLEAVVGCLWLLLTTLIALYMLYATSASSVVVRYLSYVQLYLSGMIFSAYRTRYGSLLNRMGLLLAAKLAIWFSPLFIDVLGYSALSVFIVGLFMDFKCFRAFNRRNLAYSLYLCHFPLIQLGLVIVPGHRGAVLGMLLACIVTPCLYWGVESRFSNAATPDFLIPFNKNRI